MLKMARCDYRGKGLRQPKTYRISKGDDMFKLMLLLFLPFAITIACFAVSRGRVTVKETLVQLGGLVILVAVGWFSALSNRTSDIEIWSGRVAEKTKDTMGCCHSYPCNCHEECTTDSNGSRSCSEHCDTCYQHSHDVAWNAVSTNGETVYSNGCNAPDSSVPERWTRIVVGEPTAHQHHFVNYIKGNPDSILNRQGVNEALVATVPAYPEVYDHYRVRRFLTAGAVNIPDLDRLNARLSELNAELGHVREVNMIVLVAETGDQAYLEAVRQAWLGGKKNDLITVVGVRGAGGSLEVAWAGVISWTKVEDIKIAIRDAIVGNGKFDGDQVLSSVRDNVASKFVRRNMSDFEYMEATIEPTDGVQWALFLAGILLSSLLSWYFWMHDPFRDGYGFHYAGLYPRFRR
jgi:hypothetical protein